MKRHPTRKKVSAHQRGEHRGNMDPYSNGCPLCAESFEQAKRDFEDTVSEVRAAISRGDTSRDVRRAETVYVGPEKDGAADR